MNKLLKPVTREDFVERKGWGCIVRILIDFLETGYEYAEFDWKEAGYKNPGSALASIQPTISRKKMPIRAVRRDDHVYFMRMKGE